MPKNKLILSKKYSKFYSANSKKPEKWVVNLHQIKQDTNEKVIIFSGKIRRYVEVSSRKFDRICIDYLKVGSLPHIQNRLYQRNPYTSQQAVKIAIEAETEEHAKPKTKITEPANQIATTKVSATTSKDDGVNSKLDELLTMIKTQGQQEWNPRASNTSAFPRQPQNQTFYYNQAHYNNKRRLSCYFCLKLSHRFSACRLASETDKQGITTRIQSVRAARTTDKRE